MTGAIRKNFASDNIAPICPEVMQALQDANAGSAPAYGNDPWTEALTTQLQSVFNTPLTAFPVTTGTASNSLALSALVPPYGAVISDETAHIATDEGGAPEFFTHGARLLTLPSDDGRMNPDAFTDAIARNRDGGIHSSPIRALSLTQATEWGTVYHPEAIGELAAIAHENDMPVHLDGARLANALAHLNCHPAETTWQAGIDVLTFGATKNGAMAAEAVLFFDTPHGNRAKTDFQRRIKRSGHLWSKQRYLSAQILALVKTDLWLENARKANHAAQRLAHGLARHPGGHLPFETQSNEVFAVLPEPVVERLEQAGFLFYRWYTPPGMNGILIRLVTCYETEDADVDALLAAL